MRTGTDTHKSGDAKKHFLEHEVPSFLSGLSLNSIFYKPFYVFDWFKLRDIYLSA
jgi:hypothetical protein